MPQPPKPVLAVGQRARRINPYTTTIDMAMDRLAKIEDGIRQSVQEALRATAREMDIQRRVVRKGYAANSDSVGWHEQNRTNHNWVLKRIAIVTDANNPVVLFVGSPDARGVRELFPATSFTNVTFQNGSAGYVYTDSFDNDIFVRASEDIFIQQSGAALSHLLLVTLEVEEFVPYREQLSESETFAISGTPLPAEPAQAPGVNMTQDPDEFERHEAPGTVELLQDDDLDVGIVTQDAVPLIPDAAAHLPPHLRGVA